jgi:hypothetical protein
MPRKEAALNGIAFCGLAIYLVLGAISFYTFVEPSLNGTNGWHFNPDVQKYMDLADSMRENGAREETAAVISLARNMIMPAYVGLVLQTAAHIAIFNVALFLLALGILAWTFSQLKWYVFLPIILLYPNTYEALWTLNKEIFVFLSAVVMTRWFKTRSSALMIFIIPLSMVLRWEQAFVILYFLVLLWLKVSPKRAVAILIIGISLVYPFAMASVDVGGDVRESSSSALYAHINKVQSYGLYFALLVPKIVIVFLSQVVRFWTPFINTERLHDLHTGLFVLFEQLSICFVFIVSLCKRLWVKENPVIYFVLVYAVIYLSAPENSPRYLYFLFVLIVAVLSSPELQSLRLPQ